MTDSKGNPLPQHKMVGHNSSIEELRQSMSITSFRSKAKVLLKKGLEVTYLPEEKKAEVTFPDGEKSYIEHL